jgi:hypothetical protein
MPRRWPRPSPASGSSTAPGGDLVVEEDLKTAIQAGHVVEAALDVFTVEPARSYALIDLEQVLATPLLGGPFASRGDEDGSSQSRKGRLPAPHAVRLRDGE